MKYKSEWKTNKLNKNFWKEVLEKRKILKIYFNRKGIHYLLLDNGEKIYLDGYEENLPLYVKNENTSRDKK